MRRGLRQQVAEHAKTPSQASEEEKPVEPTIVLRNLDEERTEWNFDAYHKEVDKLSDSLMSPTLILRFLLNALLQENEQCVTVPFELNLDEILDSWIATRAPSDEVTEEDGAGLENTQRIIDMRNRMKIRLQNNELCGINLYDTEKELLEKLIVPGKNRDTMPQEAEISEHERKIERSKFYPFCKLYPFEIEKAFSLEKFNKMLPGHNFNNRCYEEKVLDLTQTITSILLRDPTMTTSYDAETDSLLVALLHEDEDRIWEAPARVRPSFESWLKCKPECTEFIDMDESKVGQLWERTRTVLPADSSVFRYVEHCVGPSTLNEENRQVKKHTRTRVENSGVLYGISEDNCLWVTFYDESRIHIELTEEGCALTVTLKNGHIIKYYASGIIAQSRPGDSQSRVVLPDGPVIEYGTDSTTILHPNGNTSVNKDGIWVSTNNAGRIRKTRVADGFEWESGVVNATVQQCPESKALVTTRDDCVMIVEHTNNERVVLHADETQFIHSSDGEMLIIEGQKYIPVKIFKNQRICEMNVTQSTKIVQNLKEGVIMFTKDTGFAMKIDMNGLVFISGAKYAHLQDRYDPSAPGVHTVNLIKGFISTNDKAGNITILDNGGINQMTVPVMSGKAQQVAQQDLHQPRLFVIDSQGNPSELFNQYQIDHLKKLNKINQDYFEDSTQYPSAATLMWVTEEKEQEVYSLGSSVEIPKFVASFHQISLIPAAPLSSTFYHREFIKLPDLTPEKLKAFQNGKNRLQKWKTEKEAARNKLKVIDNRSEDVISREQQIQEKILALRGKANASMQSPGTNRSSEYGY